MKAYRIHEFGGLDGLRLDELPTPTPGPGQVLVRVQAVSLNYRDLLVLKGLYNKNFPRPAVPLSDAAGEVVEVGAGVTRVRVGDRVAPIFMQAWLAGELNETHGKSALGGAIDGVLAEFLVLHENGLVVLPDHLSFEEGSTLPCAAVTAWNALFAAGTLKAGDTILTLGTGGVSLFALQFAKLAGATVIATSSTDEKLQRVLNMGAAAGINSQATPDWEKRVRALTNGRGVDLVVEVGGAGTLSKSLHAVRTAGQISLIGVLAGGAAEINILPIVMRAIEVRGILVGSRAMFEVMNRAIRVHELRPVIDRVFPFQETPAAFRHMESAAHFGKIVIRL
ncbi:NADPH:quinone reductase [Singulisphaera sp. GP187]|uniref:zinc-dependent alcohol dehydrogenase family protein n=1 Tax=Singulisphaera sp. GP187 TaxID=1882752 RepID=UPI00092A937B|nr:NAD(P)-dependent alcohol dehydrogenase [Singulisphaera sp. GP187]SIN73332.1 NADPH:quinone reductase [Singulisphaera sp. GP187]